MTCRRNIDQRKAELGKIHIAKQQLGMDDETYRDMLFAVARVRSAADLDHAGRRAVLDHLKAIGFKAEMRKNYPGRPHNIESKERGPLLTKIEAYLTEAHLSWEYAQGIARKMFHVDQLEFCTPDQLRKIVAALEYNARRKKKREAAKQ